MMHNTTRLASEESRGPPEKTKAVCLIPTKCKLTRGGVNRFTFGSECGVTLFTAVKPCCVTTL